MRKPIKIAIASGKLTAIYSDEIADLLLEGQATVTRASHVEPENGQWVADMSPVGGPKLPPCRLRQEALDAEVEYLNTILF